MKYVLILIIMLLSSRHFAQVNFYFGSHASSFYTSFKYDQFDYTDKLNIQFGVGYDNAIKGSNNIQIKYGLTYNQLGAKYRDVLTDYVYSSQNLCLSFGIQKSLLKKRTMVKIHFSNFFMYEMEMKRYELDSDNKIKNTYNYDNKIPENLNYGLHTGFDFCFPIKKSHFGFGLYFQGTFINAIHTNDRLLLNYARGLRLTYYLKSNP